MTDATPTPQEAVVATIEEKATEAQDLAQSQQAVMIHFPAIGFIDPAEELPKVHQQYQLMHPDARLKYPEEIRAKVLAAEAAKGTPKEAETPTATDEEIALALYITVVSGTGLKVEDIEAAVTGKATPREKKPRAKAEKAAPPSLADFFGKKP